VPDRAAAEPEEQTGLGDWTAPLDETQARDHTVPRDHAEADDPAEPETRGWGALRDWTEPTAASVPAPREAPEETAAVNEPEETPEPEPVSDDTPVDTIEEERPRQVARTSLPTDVKLVSGPSYRRKIADTNPDGIKLPDTQPDGIPMVGTGDPADDDDDVYGDERAEDPDAGEDHHWPEKDADSPPPFGQFRSSPTPPRD
jgi:hypothetical protein